jgi:hypothetical protein
MQSGKELVMRLATALVSTAAAFAVLSGSAQAKELASARACDAGGCRTITDRATLRWLQDGQPAPAPARGAPFHSIRMTVKHGGGPEDFVYGLAYVPSAELLRFRGEGGYDWIAASPRAVRGLERLIRGLEPKPAGKLRGVALREDVPQPQVHRVVPAPRAATGDDFPWTLLLIPAGLALAAAAWRIRRSRGGQAAAHGPLTGQRLS